MAVSVVDNVAGNRPKRVHQRSEGQERQSDIFKQTVSPSERSTRCCAGPERQLSRPGRLSKVRGWDTSYWAVLCKLDETPWRIELHNCKTNQAFILDELKVYMNRDETVAFFLECEARRCKARVAALAEGKSQGEALEAGHEAARVHWNDWAEAHLIEREMPETTGCTKNPSANANVDFSRCVFLVKETEGAGGDAEGEIETESVPLKTITIDGPFVDMRDFVFPGEASFESTTFAGDVRFGTAIFKGNTYFDDAIFSGDAILSGHSY